MENIKAFIFDLDGTLINTLTDIALTVNHCLKSQSLPQHEEGEYVDFIGPGLEHMILRSMPEDLRDNKEILADILEEYRETYARDCLNNPVAYEGIPHVLRTLKNKGYKICVLSNKTDKFTQLMVKKVLGEIEFDGVMGGTKGVPLKPEPQGFNALCEKVGVKPSEAVMVGDAETDIGTAVNAGAQMLVATWGFRTKEFLISHGGKNLIDSPMDVLKYIE